MKIVTQNKITQSLTALLFVCMTVAQSSETENMQGYPHNQGQKEDPLAGISEPTEEEINAAGGLQGYTSREYSRMGILHTDIYELLKKLPKDNEQDKILVREYERDLVLLDKTSLSMPITQMPREEALLKLRYTKLLALKFTDLKRRLEEALRQ